MTQPQDTQTTQSNRETEHFPCDCRCHEPEYAYKYPVIPCEACSEKDTNPPTETREIESSCV